MNSSAADSNRRFFHPSYLMMGLLVCLPRELKVKNEFRPLYDSALTYRLHLQNRRKDVLSVANQLSFKGGYSSFRARTHNDAGIYSSVLLYFSILTQIRFWEETPRAVWYKQGLNSPPILSDLYSLNQHCLWVVKSLQTLQQYRIVEWLKLSTSSLKQMPKLCLEAWKHPAKSPWKNTFIYNRFLIR